MSNIKIMGLDTILALIFYLLIIGFLSVITSNTLTKEDFGYRLATYLLSSIMFGGIVINSNDSSNFNKQIYNYEKYVVKTGADKDTIIIDKKH